MNTKNHLELAELVSFVSTTKDNNNILTGDVAVANTDITDLLSQSGLALGAQ